MNSLYKSMTWFWSVALVFLCFYHLELMGQSTSYQKKAKKVAENWISLNEKMLVEISDELWMNAELPFEEYQTMKIMVDVLEAEGFRI